MAVDKNTARTKHTWTVNIIGADLQLFQVFRSFLRPPTSNLYRYDCELVWTIDSSTRLTLTHLGVHAGVK